MARYMAEHIAENTMANQSFPSFFEDELLTLQAVQEYNQTHMANSEDITSTTYPTTSVTNTNSTTHTANNTAHVANSTPIKPHDHLTLDKPNNKKRKRSNSGPGTKASKEAKGEPKPKVAKISEQFATGFLGNGEWVVDAKFACISCRRGHRANWCKDGMKGVPVQLVDHAGRPPKGVQKIDTKCNCGSVQCRCRHPSYLLKEICIDGVKKWKIAGSAVSDSKGQIVSDVLRNTDCQDGDA